VSGEEEALSGKAESAIINFYHSHRMSDRLGGHRDDVEANDSTPLVSISLGLGGIFLIEDEAIHLQSGDVLVMTNEARQSLHGVPVVFSGDSKRESSDAIKNFLEKTRISISIRQVY
jgi:alkylated DNA repair dioxygenase AlkB